jgi:hypothetical protein
MCWKIVYICRIDKVKHHVVDLHQDDRIFAYVKFDAATTNANTIMFNVVCSALQSVMSQIYQVPYVGHRSTACIRLMLPNHIISLFWRLEYRISYHWMS